MPLLNQADENTDGNAAEMNGLDASSLWIIPDYQQ